MDLKGLSAFIAGLPKITIPQWEYGVCNDRTTRRHVKDGNVQFVLWKKGDQAYVDGIGHLEDVWVNMDITWWPGFIAYKEAFYIIETMKDIFGEDAYNQAVVKSAIDPWQRKPSQLLQDEMHSGKVSSESLRGILDGRIKEINFKLSQEKI